MMSEIPRIPIAVVGFGRFGSLHAQRLRSHPGFHLECVVDPSAEGRARAEAMGFVALPGVERLPGRVRAATIATPSETHADVAIQLMHGGLDVLVEKPLATTVADVDRMLQASSMTGRILCTAHIERFNPRKVCPGDDGTIEFRRIASALRPAREAVLDLMVHDLDLAAYWLGFPAEAPLQVASVRQDDVGVEAQACIGATRLRFRAGYGGESSHSSIRLGLPDVSADKLAQACAYFGEDALARQYSAFHEAMQGRSSTIADGAAGASAVRRALAILSAL